MLESNVLFAIFLKMRTFIIKNYEYIFRLHLIYLIFLNQYINWNGLKYLFLKDHNIKILMLYDIKYLKYEKIFSLNELIIFKFEKIYKT